MKSLLFSAGLLLITSCSKQYEDYPSEQEPRAVYMSYELLRSSVRFDPPQPIAKRGKIYLYGTTLLINEPNKGVHIFDNSNPALPVAKGFLNVPGNVDIAVKEGVLYLDSFIDLIAVDLTSGNLTVTKRIKEVFDYDAYQALEDWAYFNYDESQGVVVGYEN